MVSATFTAEAKKFCQTTSVRGIPRIINSKSTGQSVIWLIGVFCCAAILIWQLCVIFLRYRTYPVNSLFVQGPQYDNTTFPDITICNLCSLVHERDMPLSYTDYLMALGQGQRTQKYRKFFQNVSASLAYQIGFALQSEATYFHNFPVGMNFTNDGDQPIIDCNFFNWDYGPNENFNCTANVELIWDPNFYKCYTLRLKNTERKKVRGFSAVVYVDTYIDSMFQDYHMDLLNSSATGIQVLVHAPGTAPNMELGVNVGPGTATTITLEQTKLKYLPAPYSNCTTQSTLGDIDNTTTYSQTYCVDVCLQQQYLRECGCIVSNLQFTESQLVESNFSVCGNLGITSLYSSLDVRGLEQFVCVGTFKVDMNACQKSCFNPCQELRYSSTLSTAPWPRMNSLVSFYYQYLFGDPRFVNISQELQAVTNLMFLSQNSPVVRDMLNKIDKDGLVKDNFLQLNIKFNLPSYNVQNTVAAYPLDAFGAQAGGVLSLWLGVTIMLIFEVCEFLINLMFAVYASKKDKSAAPTIVVVESRS